MSVRSRYPMLGLVSDAFPYRIEGERFGRYGSLVMVAPCNMACAYCDVGGYAKDSDNNLPNHREIETAEIEQFVCDETDRGNIIYFTGGEPLMFPDLMEHLARIVKERGGYSALCSNATYYSRMERVSPLVNEFSISLKGSRRSSKDVAGVPQRLAFDLPYRNSLRARALPNQLEMVIVLFEDLDLEQIDDIYGPFVGRAYLAFKEYRPKKTTTHEDHTYESVLVAGLSDSVRPMPRAHMTKIFEGMVERHPKHASMFNLVTGGGGEQRVRTRDRDYLFVR